MLSRLIPISRAAPARSALLGMILSTAVAGPGAAGEPAKRIVAAGGAITEIIYALGQSDRLVGVDSTSQFPAEALKSKPDVGYLRALSAEGILSLKPDLVLAVEGAGPPDALRLLSETKVPVAMVPEDLTEAGILSRIRRVGEIVAAPEQALRLGGEVSARFAALDQARMAIPAKKRVLFVLSLQNGRALVGGRNTSAAAMIALAGAINAAEDVEGFKPLSDEGLIAAAPEAIIMMSRGNHAASAEEVFARPAFSVLPAAKTHALIVMDGLYLLGFGPRAPDAARDLMQAIYARPTKLGQAAP